MMNRSCRVVAALLFLLLAGNELWAQRPLRALRSADFHRMLLRELELQRQTPTPLFEEINPVFLFNEAAVTRMVYDPATGVLRWRYTLRPGVGRVAAARVAARLRNFLIRSLIRRGLVTQAQIDANEFRVEVLGGEEGAPPEGVIPPGGPGKGMIEEGVEVPAMPPPARQPAENAPQTVATVGSLGYVGYYPWWGGWGWPGYWCNGCNWGWGWCGGGWFDCYYWPCGGYGWGYPWWGYYPVAYPTAAVAAAPVQAAVTTARASQAPRTGSQTQLAAARLSRVSLYGKPTRADILDESRSSAPTFYRKPTGANPQGLFWDGYTLYWQGRYQDALDSIDAALAEHRDDARFWYYKALCEKALGQTRLADASARQARKLRAQGLPALEQIGSALERVQGNDRRFLNGEADALARR